MTDFIHIKMSLCSDKINCKKKKLWASNLGIMEKYGLYSTALFKATTNKIKWANVTEGILKRRQSWSYFTVINNNTIIVLQGIQTKISYMWVYIVDSYSTRLINVNFLINDSFHWQSGCFDLDWNSLFECGFGCLLFGLVG